MWELSLKGAFYIAFPPEVADSATRIDIREYRGRWALVVRSPGGDFFAAGGYLIWGGEVCGLPSWWEKGAAIIPQVAPKQDYCNSNVLVLEKCRSDGSGSEQQG